MLARDVLDPVGRRAPPGIARALEATEPGARLVYLGHGYWQLVRPRPKTDERLTHAVRAQAAAWNRRDKGREDAHARQLRRYALAAAGYVLWPRVSFFAGDPDGRIVQEFREGLFRMRHEADYLAQVDAAEQARRDRATAELSDPAMAGAASRAARNPTTFTMPGLKRSA